MNFGYGELRQLLYGGGDTREPLPDTMRLLDEIATDFIQGLSFEAARVAHYAGRQKIKYEDFEFALRRNPLFLGKVREMFEMSKEVKDARKMPGIGEGNLGKADVNELAKFGEDTEGDPGGSGGAGGTGGTGGRAGTAGAAGEGEGAGGVDGRSSVTGVSQKRKYNKTGESKKKKKARLEEEAAAASAAAEAAAAAALVGGGDGAGGDGEAHAEADADADAEADADADGDIDEGLFGDGDLYDDGDGGHGLGGVDGSPAERRDSMAQMSGVGDDGDDLADLDGELDAELR